MMLLVTDDSNGVGIPQAPNLKLRLFVLVFFLCFPHI